jgi:hypothetical protein
MTDGKALEKALALLQRLYARTLAGTLDWQEAGSSGVFKTRLGDFELEITEIPDRDYFGSPDYLLRVLDAHSGKEIERISNASLGPVMDRATPEGLNPYELLNRTHELARRSALNVDNALEQILNELGSR